MKTILFFDRCELTYLYGLISKYIEDAQVRHVAYSKKEADILINMGITPDIVYMDEYKLEYDRYEEDNLLLSTIDTDIIKYSDGRFNLNSSIQSDRAFSILSYEESLHASTAHYLTWKKIFGNWHVDLLIHEPCSLFFNHIASILCNKQGGTFAYQIQMEGDKDGFYYLFANNDSYLYQELQDKYEHYLKHPELIDRERCCGFLEKFRKERSVFFGSIINLQQPIWRLYINALKSYFLKLLRRKEEDRRYNLIDYWLMSQNYAMNKIRNIHGYKKHHIKFVEELPIGEKYFFYPMHLEPEAVILYLGDGIYANQIKLIENVAASLPPGYYLYVKDHPHEFAYRNPDDYERLLRVPNIRLLKQWLPGKDIIRGCEGLVTINGTAGFEALLMGKQVYCFGRNQYSFQSRVNYIKNIRDFRDTVYANLGSKTRDDDALYAYIMGYLDSLHVGYVNYFLGTVNKAEIDQEENAKIIAKDIVNYANQLERYQ